MTASGKEGNVSKSKQGFKWFGRKKEEGYAGQSAADDESGEQHICMLASESQLSGCHMHKERLVKNHAPVCSTEA